MPDDDLRGARDNLVSENAVFGGFLLELLVLVEKVHNFIVM